MADIAALQHMYGADFSTNGGNTVYKWTPGSGSTFVNGDVAIKPGANKIFATIWDGGGVDTLSAFNQAEGCGLFGLSRIQFNTTRRPKYSYEQNLNQAVLSAAIVVA